VRFLLDTNIVSELRRGPKANAGVMDWFDDQSPRDLCLSVVTIGEIQQGIEQLRDRDSKQAVALERWLTGILQFYEDRILYIDGDIALDWGRLGRGRSRPVIDRLLAATARVHGLTLVTRNTRDFKSLDVRVLNPWSA